MKYRSEIDGLRALAVLPVIFFHAGFQIFGGGFVGVDIFFVISGYLITTIIIEEIIKEKFSIINFYERRARRILPALFFIMLVCIPFAWITMLPSQIKDFSQSLIAVSLFASNIFFWKESGYFEAAAEEKPLLHTWSLAVEEQYYLLFPIFLIFAWRLGKDKVFWIIAILAFLSLILSEWGWRNAETANFYLAPTRAWELFAGSLAAFIIHKKGVKKNDTLSCIGLFAILLSIFIYDKHTPFPSLYSLLPIGGVLLLILFAHKDTYISKILSNRVLVGIGLISYSAYLWHQPLFAFARIGSLNEPSTNLMLLLSIASILFAYFSWKFVESPFRNKKLISRSRIFVFSLAGFLLFLIIGILGHLEILKPKITSKQENILKSFEEISMQRMQSIYPSICHYTGESDQSVEEFLSKWNCHKEFKKMDGIRFKVAIAGDSNAADIANGFRINQISLSSMTGSGCSLVPSMMSKECKKMFDYYLENINDKKDIDFLILTNLFDQREYNKKSLKEMISYWSKFAGKVIFLHDTPRFPNHYHSLLKGKTPNIDLTYNNVKITTEGIAYIESYGFYAISRNEYFCSINSCSYFSENGIPLIADERGEHLSLDGAMLFNNVLVEQLIEIKKI